MTSRRLLRCRPGAGGVNSLELHEVGQAGMPGRYLAEPIGARFQIEVCPGLRNASTSARIARTDSTRFFRCRSLAV